MNGKSRDASTSVLPRRGCGDRKQGPLLDRALRGAPSLNRACRSLLKPGCAREASRQTRSQLTVFLHIKARARELAVVMLRSNHEYRGAGHREAAVTRGVSEDRCGRVNRVFGFSALVADFDDVALRRLGNRTDRGIGHY